MEPPQAEPLRRRRRRLIVAFVVVLAGLAWWNWPRGDARFVGKWIDSRDPEGVYDFRPTGVVYWSNRQASRPTSWTHWRVDGEIPLLGQDPNRSEWSPLHPLYAGWEKVTGQQWIAHGWYGPHRITAATADSISVVEFDEQSETSRDEFTFTRIPE
jgi:hypothetical protein